MNKVQFNIFDALGKLQTLKNRRYNAAQITEIINGMHGEKVITRQTVARLLRKGDTVISAVSDSTIGYLLDFFEQEGMPIAIKYGNFRLYPLPLAYWWLHRCQHNDFRDVPENEHDNRHYIYRACCTHRVCRVTRYRAVCDSQECQGDGELVIAKHRYMLPLLRLWCVNLLLQTTVNHGYGLQKLVSL